MKIGKLNSRISRVGQKLKSDIGSAVGKTQKVIQKGERGVVKGINAVASVADSKVVRGIQQGTLVGGRVLGATGIPELQAAGAGLTGVGLSIKGAREVIPDKVARAKGKVSSASNKLQGRIAAEKAYFDKGVDRGVRLSSKISGNELERGVPMAQSAPAAQYID